MTRDELTRKILAAKRAKGLSWKTIVAEIGGGSAVYLTAALMGQMKLRPEQAERAAALFDLTEEEKSLLREVPYRGSLPAAVNHAAVLPACRAVVHHGGAGTTAAGLRAGIPTLILWQWLDQPVWAAGVERLGVGSARQLSATTLESLTADLRSILPPECSARAREVATRMTASAESLAMAADLIEEAARMGRVGGQGKS